MASISRVSAEITITPLSNRGLGLMDALEAKMGQRAYSVNPDTGARTYRVESDSAGVDAFEETLNGIDPDWREHLARTE